MRRVMLGVTAAVVLVGVSVAVVATRKEPTVRSDQLFYSHSLLRARAMHTATLLPDGRVLIVGGCATHGCSTADGSPDTEFYVPGRGFTAGPDLDRPRGGHTATLLADGRVLITGGWPREGTDPTDSAVIFRPDTETFEPIGSMTAPRGAHTATMLADGRVLLTGGTTAETFDPARNAFTATAMPPGLDAVGALALDDGGVLVLSIDGSAVVYDPTTDSWRRTGSLGTPRSKVALAPLPDGRVLVLGGTVDRVVLATTEIYDPRSGQFSPGPAMDTERYKFADAVAVVGGGRIVIAGGAQVAVYEGGVFRPIAGTAGSARWLPTLTLLPDGDVLVLGGYDQRTRVRDDVLLIGSDQLG